MSSNMGYETGGGEDPLSQLMGIKPSDGADIYILALALRNQILTGKSCKLDATGNVVGGWTDGYTVKVVPVITQEIPENEVVKHLLRTTIEKGYVLVAAVTPIMVSGNLKFNLVLSFLKHVDSLQEVKAICAAEGSLNYIDHVLNEETGLAGASFFAYNPQERVVEVLASKINGRISIRPNAC